MSKGYIVLGVKHGEFKDDRDNTIPFHQLALDMGSYLKVFKVKDKQSGYLNTLEPGTVLCEEDGFVADKFFVFI